MSLDTMYRRGRCYFWRVVSRVDRRRAELSFASMLGIQRYRLQSTLHRDYSAVMGIPTADVEDRIASEVVYICIAADLLRQMMTELQRTDDSRLAPDIAAARRNIHQRLDLLLEGIESLVAEDNPARAADIGRRAKLTIYRLAGEIEQLAIQAQVDAGSQIADPT
jgi:outer membrane PBP1 activator LpoA protein